MRRRPVREFLLALIISLGVHALFVVYSVEHSIAPASALVAASEEIYQAPVREWEPEPPRRPVLNREEVANRAENAFQDIRDVVSPDLPAVPDLVAEDVLSEKNLGNGSESELPGLGPNPNMPGVASEGDLLDDLFSTTKVQVFESAQRMGKDHFTAEAVRVGSLGGGGGKGGGWTVPSIDSPPPLEGNAPEPLVGKISPVDVAKLDVPEVPPIDIGDLEVAPPTQEGLDIPPVPPLDNDAGVGADTKLDPYLSIEIETYHDETGQGFFRIRIRPNEKSGELEVLPKDIVFVLDASTSIGQRLYWFQRGIQQCIANLNPADRFNVVGFKEQVSQFQSALVPATERNRGLAIEFSKGLDSSGRTDIYKSLATILEAKRSPGRPFIMLLLSDGRPTVGLRDTRLIIQDLTLNNRWGGSIFALGVGDEKKINKYLLDMLSYLNRGFVRIETFREGIEYTVLDMYESLDNPLLMDIRGDYGAVNPAEVFPRQLPDLYREGTIEIYGKFTDEKDVYFRLEGMGPGGKRMDYVDRGGFPKDNGTSEIAREWAFRKIYSLIGEMCLEGETPEKLNTIRGFAEKYAIQTPYE